MTCLISILVWEDTQPPMDDNQSNPGENLPAGEEAPVKQLTPSFTAQPKEMEVHHHGHVHEKKKWREYVFQFLMLFLAVFLGFLAENLREDSAERSREREYIESLVVDLAADHAAISTMTRQIDAQINGFDTLQTMFSSGDLINNQAKVYDCYYYSSYLQLSFPVNFNERTITQLLSSGNMRLLRAKAAADSVTDYFNLIKDVEAQKQMYIDNINKCTELMFNIYDITYLRRMVNNRDSLVFINPDWSSIRLLSTNADEIRKFIATMEVTKLIIHSYKIYLALIDNRCLQLRDFLRKEYHLKP